MYCILTTLSKKQRSLQLCSNSPPLRSVVVVLSPEGLLFLQLWCFRFQPKKGMRPMMKDKIHKMAMISLAVFPVINSLYLEGTADIIVVVCHMIALMGAVLL